MFERIMKYNEPSSANKMSDIFNDAMSTWMADRDKGIAVALDKVLDSYLFK